MDSSESLRIDRFDHDPKKLKLEEVFQKKPTYGAYIAVNASGWLPYICKYTYEH